MITESEVERARTSAIECFRKARIVFTRGITVMPSCRHGVPHEQFPLPLGMRPLRHQRPHDDLTRLRTEWRAAEDLEEEIMRLCPSSEI